jgi:hypothetical protein
VQRFVVIRDTAGEDLESGDMTATHFRYFGNADAVFFMFDRCASRGFAISSTTCYPPSPTAAATHGRC